MTSILSLLCFRETLNGQEAPAIPKPTQEHGWLQKFAGEWRNESMATMGRNIRLLHLRHPQNWGEQDTEIGLSIMRSVYGLNEPKKILDSIIPIATNRQR
ncbi:MAG: hypothetical protein ACK5OC_21460 [Pirellula sp.]|jgi:hypothetical protein